jgi:hypothetical protein
MRSAPSLHKESILCCELVRQLEASYFNSETSRELKAEEGSWQLEVSRARVLAAEENTG